MKKILIALATLAVAGCRVGPDHAAPRPAMPAAFLRQGAPFAPDGETESAAWWRAFHDTQLDSLIAEVATANHDMRLAAARVRESRAAAGVVDAALVPRVDAGGSFSRSRISQNSRQGRQAGLAGESPEGDLFHTALDMSWEIDVFGGARRASEAARADLGAGIEQQRDVLVSVLAEAGLAYLDLRSAQKQLVVAREHLRAQEETLALTADRARAGLASELDVSRARALVHATRARIPAREEQEQRAIHRLGVLTGRPPEGLDERLAKAQPIPAPPPRVPLGLPSALLRQRPDIRRAERELAAATARLGAAQAEWFPRFFLTGAAGLESVEATDLVDGGSRYWSLGPAMRWPIFNAGKIRQNIRVHNARQEQALIRYEQTVVRALEEVENALTSFGKEQERHDALGESERSSAQSARWAQDRYRGGLAGFLEVLEAERSHLDARASLIESERLLGQNYVRLYKALGGGWSDATVDPFGMARR